MPQRRDRCGAKLPSSEGRLNRADRCRHLAQYLRRSGHRCRNWPVRGKKRCRFHGGYSTGPTTPEGKARTIAALQAGRARWLRRLRDEGSPIPCGRRKGGRNRPLEEREQIAFEKRVRREAEKVLREVRAECKAPVIAKRQENKG